MYLRLVSVHVYHLQGEKNGTFKPMTSCYLQSCYFCSIYDTIYDMIYLTAIGLTPGGSSTVHIYTQTIHRTTQFTN